MELKQQNFTLVFHDADGLNRTFMELKLGLNGTATTPTAS